MDHAGRDLGVVEGFAFRRRPDAHVVVRDAGDEDARGGGCPLVEVSFDPVGVVAEKGCEFGELGADDVGGADERGDDDGECGGRVAGVLLPAFLLCHRSVADEEAGGACDEGNDVEAAEGVELPETPGEDDGERDLVKLNAGPVGRAVDPEVLREAAVRVLRAGEVDESAESCLGAAAGEQSGRGLDHVARPDEMIAAEIVVGLGGSPGDGGGGDEGAGVGLVLVGEDDVVRDAHKTAAVSRCRDETLGRGGAMPLLDEALAMDLIRRGEALHHARNGRVMAVTERDSNGELAVAGDAYLAHDGDVAVERLAEVPGHSLMLAEVLITVTCTDEAAAGAIEATVGAEGERDAILPGEDSAMACHIDGPGGVARTAS